MDKSFFLYSHEEECRSSLIFSNKIKARHFQSTKCIIDDLCVTNDDGEFGRSICEIYPKELERKVENQWDQATFLNLDMSIIKGTFLYKLFDKRDSFPFSVVRMPQRKQYPSKYFLFSNQRQVFKNHLTIFKNPNPIIN